MQKAIKEQTVGKNCRELREIGELLRRSWDRGEKEYQDPSKKRRKNALVNREVPREKTPNVCPSLAFPEHSTSRKDEEASPSREKGIEKGKRREAPRPTCLKILVKSWEGRTTEKGIMNDNEENVKGSSLLMRIKWRRSFSTNEEIQVPQGKKEK